jgi:hypothetical protein
MVFHSHLCPDDARKLMHRIAVLLSAFRIAFGFQYIKTLRSPVAFSGISISEPSGLERCAHEQRELEDGHFGFPLMREVVA